MHRKRATAALATVLLLGGCGATDGAKEPNGIEISVANIAYSPASLDISVGDKVTWTSEDEGVRHTVTSGLPAGESVPGVSEGEAAKPDGAFAGALDDAGASFSFTFDNAGSYAYFCEVHPSMTAEIVVR